ncbi:MAG: bifunctional oligoribonuclease/PAP phosphatase NrnA [Ekhidna sp.]|uniref:DHH family phosphoesterase n=1 Tax=Ekhidna sp. TaxID=2608089 RepID=UPI0032EE6509
MKDTQALKDFLQTPRKIVITTHANPDADALGSSLGLHHFLVRLGQEVSTIVPNSYPDFLEWMPGNPLVINYEKNKEKSDELIFSADLLFCLDYSGFGRIKDMKEVAEGTKAKIALVDHHLNPEINPDFNFWDDHAAATAELIYDLIVDYSGKEVIDKGIAECLYAGIMTDTGSFKHPSTTSKIHRMVAELIDLGADVNKVSRLIYDTNSLHRLKFLGHALAEKLKVNEEARIAYFVIGEEDFKDFRLKQGDTEGLVNYALSIKGIVVAAIIIQRENEIKLSFRSIGDFAVNKFAEEYFRGGGHKNASGGMSELSLKETEEKFKKLIEEDILKTHVK